MGCPLGQCGSATTRPSTSVTLRASHDELMCRHAWACNFDLYVFGGGYRVIAPASICAATDKADPCDECALTIEPVSTSYTKLYPASNVKMRMMMVQLNRHRARTCATEWGSAS